MDEKTNKRIKKRFDEYTGAWDINLDQKMK